MYTKGFEVVFSVNGSMIDDKIVHKGLKIKFFLNPSLLGVELGISKICGLKKVQI